MRLCSSPVVELCVFRVTGSLSDYRCCFQIFFYVHPGPFGKMNPIWRYNIFQRGWFNRQLGDYVLKKFFFFGLEIAWNFLPIGVPKTNFYRCFPWILTCWFHATSCCDPADPNDLLKGLSIPHLGDQFGSLGSWILTGLCWWWAQNELFRMTMFLMKWRAKGRNKVGVEHYLGIDDFVARIWLNCLTCFRLIFFFAFAMLIRCFICLFPQEGYDYFEKWEDHIGLKESVWSCQKHSSIRCWHIL